MSSCNHVIIILSSHHTVIPSSWSSCHPVIMSLCHYAIMSSHHHVIWSSSYPIIMSFQYANDRTHNIWIYKSASQTIILMLHGNFDHNYQNQWSIFKLLCLFCTKWKPTKYQIMFVQFCGTPCNIHEINSYIIIHIYLNFTKFSSWRCLLRG